MTSDRLDAIIGSFLAAGKFRRVREAKMDFEKRGIELLDSGLN